MEVATIKIRQLFYVRLIFFKNRHLRNEKFVSFIFPESYIDLYSKKRYELLFTYNLLNLNDCDLMI